MRIGLLGKKYSVIVALILVLALLISACAKKEPDRSGVPGEVHVAVSGSDESGKGLSRSCS